MKVSIITPVYNRELYLSKAIDSVLNQTYQNYELILVDDGSEDGSARIIESYKAKYPEKIVVISQKNAGPTIAKNNGIRASKGELIAFLDSDDFIEPNKLELQVNIFKQNPHLAFVYTGYCIVDTNGHLIRTVTPDPKFSGDIYEKLWLIESEISGGTIMAKRKMLEKAGLFDETLRGAENLDLRIKLSQHGNVSYVNTPLYSYRKHDDNLTSQTQLMSSNRLAIIENHFGENGDRNRSLWKKVMANHYYKIGCESFSTMDLVVAKKQFLLSIRKQPYNFVSWKRLFRCMLGIRINLLLAKLKSNTNGDCQTSGRDKP